VGLNSAGRLAFPSVTTLTCAVNLVAGACPSATTGTGSLVLYDGTSDFNSLQATLERRLSHGLTLKAIFAWSKSLADNSDTLAGTPGALSDASILNDVHYDKGPLPFNVGKNFTLNWIYDVPLGKHDRLAGLALNGWQFAGIYHQQSGIPFSLADGVAQTFGAVARADNNPAGAPVLPEFPKPEVVQYFNPAAFVPASFQVLGNSTVGAGSGPGLANVDVTLMKYFDITERFRLQFRVDAFNLLNHPNFAIPASSLYTGIVNSTATSAAGATAGNSCFIGTATGTGISTPTPCGQTQFAAGEVNPVGTAGTVGAGQITSTASDSRVLQFALKLVF
jgi:hypothetical protein